MEQSRVCRSKSSHGTAIKYSTTGKNSCSLSQQHAPPHKASRLDWSCGLPSAQAGVAVSVTCNLVQSKDQVWVEVDVTKQQHQTSFFFRNSGASKKKNNCLFISVFLIVRLLIFETALRLTKREKTVYIFFSPSPQPRPTPTPTASRGRPPFPAEGPGDGPRIRTLRPRPPLRQVQVGPDLLSTQHGQRAAHPGAGRAGGGGGGGHGAQEAVGGRQAGAAILKGGWVCACHFLGKASHVLLIDRKSCFLKYNIWNRMSPPRYTGSIFFFEP